MSRLYSMSVGVELKPEDTPAVIEKIKAALSAVWPEFEDTFEVWESHSLADSDVMVPALHGYGDGSLCGGMTEEEFAEWIAEEVWKAAGGYRVIDVGCTCLENLPVEHHCPDEEDYERIMEAKA